MRLHYLQAFLALAEELNYRLVAAAPGNSDAAATPHIPGWAHLPRHGHTTVIHVGGDNMPSPDLQMTTTPYA